MHQVETSCTFSHPAERVREAMRGLASARPDASGSDREVSGRGRADLPVPQVANGRGRPLTEHRRANAGAAEYGPVTFEVLDTRLPVRLARIVLVLSDQGHGRSKLTLTMLYQPKYGVLGRAISATAMKPIIRNMLCRVLLCFDEYVLSRPAESGSSASQTGVGRDLGDVAGSAPRPAAGETGERTVHADDMLALGSGAGPPWRSVGRRPDRGGGHGGLRVESAADRGAAAAKAARGGNRTRQVPALDRLEAAELLALASAAVMRLIAGPIGNLFDSI